MGDSVQVAIVTAAAAVALVALVRPYVRKPAATKSAPACANCPSSSSASSKAAQEHEVDGRARSGSSSAH